MRLLRFVGSSLACALLALPTIASADVLQIDGESFAWVAGGPQTGATGVVQPQDATAPMAGIEADPSSLTHVADAAGPAEWRARVAKLAAKYDISPALLEAVVWQESRWNSSAVSSAGARGLAQLMPGTARQMGVNPDDPFANLEGGARYLRMQLDAFDGDLEKALAAYNAGPARVIAAGGIPRIPETQNYVASVMARLSQPVRD